MEKSELIAGIKALEIVSTAIPLALDGGLRLTNGIENDIL